MPHQPLPIAHVSGRRQNSLSRTVSSSTNKLQIIAQKKSDKGPSLSLGSTFHHNVRLSANHLHDYPSTHQHDSTEHDATCSRRHNRLLTRNRFALPVHWKRAKVLRAFDSLFVVGRKYRDRITSSFTYGNTITNTASSAESLVSHDDSRCGILGVIMLGSMGAPSGGH